MHSIMVYPNNKLNDRELHASLKILFRWALLSSCILILYFELSINSVGMPEIYHFFYTFWNFFPSAVVRELDVPGTIVDNRVYPFEFQAVEMSHDSYYGVHVQLRYEYWFCNSCFIYFILIFCSQGRDNT